MELLGRYSNLAKWAKKLDRLAGMTEQRPQSALHKTVRKLRPDEVEALVAAYEAGVKIYELASQFKIHRTTASLHLHRRGVAAKSPTDSRKNREGHPRVVRDS